MKSPVALTSLALGPGVLATTPALAQTNDDLSWWSGGWGHMASGGLMMLVVWGGLIVLAVVLVRYLSRDTPNRTDPSALEILQQRFARGEIDQQEYEARRRLLLEHRT